MEQPAPRPRNRNRRWAWVALAVLALAALLLLAGCTRTVVEPVYCDVTYYWLEDPPELHLSNCSKAAWEGKTLYWIDGRWRDPTNPAWDDGVIWP